MSANASEDEDPGTDDSRDPDETFSQSSMDSDDEDIITYEIVWQASRDTERRGYNGDYVKFKLVSPQSPAPAEEQGSSGDGDLGAEHKVYFSAGEWQAKYSCTISTDQKTFSNFSYLWMNDMMAKEDSMGEDDFCFKTVETLDENGYPFLKTDVDCGYSGCAPEYLTCWAKRRHNQTENPSDLTDDEWNRLQARTDSDEDGSQHEAEGCC